MSGNISLFFLVCFPLLGSLLVYIIGRYDKTVRDYGVQFICICELLLFFGMLVQYLNQPIPLVFDLKDFCGMGLHLKMDGFRVLYGTIAAFMWALTSLLSKQYFGHYHNRNRYYFFFLVTLGATVGVFLSADLYTTFIFFEMMSFTSYVWVVHDEKKESLRAGSTYLAVAVIGGLVMLMGLFLLYDTIGTLTISEIWPAVQDGRKEMEKVIASSSFVPESEMASGIKSLTEYQARLYAAGFCMLFGFGAKAGMFPLHGWLPTAHPVAPAPASAVLSGVITKAGVLGIIRSVYYVAGPDMIKGTWVQYTWIILSILTIFMGSMMAYKEKVLKKRLAYSTVSQVSYILFGLSVMQPIAFVGALMHVIFHSLVKNTLFVSAGAIICKTGKTKVRQLVGIGKEMPVTMWCFTLVSLTLIGIPPTSAFVSKWYLISGALDSGIPGLSWVGPVVLLISALLTAGYLLTISIKAFFPGEDYDYTKLVNHEPTWRMLLPMVVMTALAVILGIWPSGLMKIFADIAASVL